MVLERLTSVNMLPQTYIWIRLRKPLSLQEHFLLSLEYILYVTMWNLVSPWWIHFSNNFGDVDTCLYGKKVWKEVQLWDTMVIVRRLVISVLKDDKNNLESELWKREIIIRLLETFYLFSLISPRFWIHGFAIVMGSSENGYMALLAFYTA